MKIKMKLLSDTIFGNGMSIPGAEDISVLHDEEGFPFYRGSSFKGVFREEFERYLAWNSELKVDTGSLFGNAGDDDDLTEKIVFSDFELSDPVKSLILEQIGEHPDMVYESLTNLRTFTAMDGKGVVKPGSLRVARCVNKGMVFYGEIYAPETQEKVIEDVLPFVKWIGSMRNRGFGKIKLEVVKEVR